jgi:penicillin-insensitive murein DD-endopeptidase
MVNALEGEDRPGMTRSLYKSCLTVVLTLSVAITPVQAADDEAAKESVHAPTPGNVVQPIKPIEPVVAAKALFGAAAKPAPLAARAIGAYAKGCLAGGVALPVDGPAWQAMRLARNRNWGHPKLVELVQTFAEDAKAKDGWPGLLVGDISQPRGGPMLTGHASHQIGLDADIWFTPMPNRRLTSAEREEMSATSMLTADELAVNPKVFTPTHVALLKRAASYSGVERVLVHPAIKKAICEATAADTNRDWLKKVRPIWGHYYHFHIRIGCPAGSTTCAPQAAAPGDDGCGKELADWYKLLTAPPGPPTPPKPPLTLEQLPTECRAVLQAGR